MGWVKSASGDAEVDKEMETIRQVGGERAAQGMPPERAPERAPEQPQLPQERRSGGWLTEGQGGWLPAPKAEVVPKKPWHPGSILDTVMSPVDPTLSKDLLGEPPKPTVREDTPWHPGKMIGAIGDAARELTHDVLTTGIDLALTPMSYMIPGAGEVPRVTGRIAGQPRIPVETPVVQVPSAVPSVLDLARQHQDKLLRGQPPSAATSTVGQVPEVVGKYGDVRMTPTGSLTRGMTEHLYTQDTGHTLAHTGTGSLVQLEHTDPKPMPYPVGPTGRVEGIPLPAEREWQPPVRTEPPLPPSKRLHGAEYEYGLAPGETIGPPKPPLRSAEDLLAEKQAQFEARRQEAAAQGLPDVVVEEPPELLALMTQPEQAGPRSAVSPVPTTGPTYTQQTPGLLRRGFLHAFDVLDDMGPYTRRIGDILRYSFDYSEAGTKQNFLDYLGLVKQLYGGRTLSKRAQLLLEGDWGGVLNRSIRDFGLTKKEQHALVELHEIASHSGFDYTQPLTPELIQRSVSPKAWETLKAELLDPRVQELFQKGWRIFSGRASSLPSVQAKATVFDPVTGKSEPVGPPTPFWPHQPVRDETKRILTESNLRAMYNKGGYAASMDYPTFVHAMENWMKSGDPTVKLRRFAGLENKRHLDMLEDAKSHNRTVAESLDYYGYETDPLRAMLRYNLYALKRSVFLEYGDELAAMRQQVRREYGGAGAKMYQWTEKVIERAQGISAREDMMTQTSKAWEIAQAIFYPAVLKASWSQNFLLQPNYIAMQTGIKPVAQAIWRRYGRMLGLTEQDILQSAERSAANFPSFMSKYHMPDGPMAQYNKTANELNLFNMSDSTTRNWAGEVFIPTAEDLIRKWYRDPANPKWKEALKEGNLNPDELMKKMSAADRSTWDSSGIPPIPPEALMRYAQVQSNRAMGRTGVRSLPLWMSGEGQTQRLFMTLHRQIASNEGVFWRNISNAPTAGIGLKRALRAVFGAELAGTLYQGLTNWIVGNNFFDVNEPLAKSFKNNKEAAFAVKSLLLGLGTFTSGLILSGLNAHAGNYGGMTYGVLSPPVATFVDELVQKAEQGKWGDVALRLNPFQTVDVIAKRHAKEEKRRKQAAMPGQGLNTGVGLSQ